MSFTLPYIDDFVKCIIEKEQSKKNERDEQIKKEIDDIMKKLPEIISSSCEKYIKIVDVLYREDFCKELEKRLREKGYEPSIIPDNILVITKPNSYCNIL
jgi:broad-specificity NMP kinase